LPLFFGTVILGGWIGLEFCFYSDFGPVWQKNTGPNLFVGLFELFLPIVKVTVQYRAVLYGVFRRRERMYYTI
jgi:hypothetical protein